MSLYGAIRKGWGLILPKAMRNAIYMAMPTFLKVLRGKAIRLLQKSARHGEIYDEEYYATQSEPYMRTSCDAIAESIAHVFSPKSAIDVGCGTGLLLLALKERGVCCRGLEYSEVALDTCRRRGLEVVQLDLEHDDLPSDCRADVAISTEVAEHLPESCAHHFVDILCDIADNILLTAALPSPSYIGTDHVNERPKEYWIAKFEARGFRYEKELSDQCRASWKKQDVCGVYLDSSLMIFRKRA